MRDRRRFLKRIIGGGFSLLLMGGLIPSAFGKVFAAVKKIVLPKETTRESLVQRNPANLDAAHVEITPLKDFGVMGLSDHTVDPASWRLTLSGAGETTVEFSYAQILEMPALERKVLMICPGVFANIGLWKGISIQTLINAAGFKEKAAAVILSGPKGSYTKTQRFPMEDIRSDRVFLAYLVNGKALPQKHGFPLRAVAEGYYGYDWIKYVDRIEIQET